MQSYVKSCVREKNMQIIIIKKKARGEGFCIISKVDWKNGIDRVIYWMH